ncbi:MAG: hypothetical protein ACRCVU_10660 [Flavobacterium sp.]
MSGMLYYLIFFVVVILIGMNKKWSLKTKVIAIVSFIAVYIVFFLSLLAYTFDRDRRHPEPPALDEYNREVDYRDQHNKVMPKEEVDVTYSGTDTNKEASINSNIGERIYGDFNGDGKYEYAYRKLVKEGSGGSRVDGGVPEEYEIQFSDSTIQPIPVGCCWFTLINKGDLDNDGADEIIIVQDPHNGCHGRVQTYTIKNNKSSYLFEPFYLFICDGVSDEDMLGLIVKENYTVYYYEVDLNTQKRIKKKAVFIE